MKKSFQKIIVPGILESDIKIIKSYIKDMTPYFTNKKINKIQFDICDGIFVKSESFGKNEKELKNLILLANTLTDLYNLNIQMDMMIKMKTFTKDDKSQNKLDDFLNLISLLNRGEIIIHYDSMNIDEWSYLVDTVKNINKENKTPNKGLTIIPAFVFKNFKEQDFDNIVNFLSLYKFKKIQIMGIKTIGKQGQKLAEETFKILKDIKANQTINKIKIQIDGGCSSQNIENIIQAGADGVVFGSQIFRGQVKDNLKSIFI